MKVEKKLVVEEAGCRGLGLENRLGPVDLDLGLKSGYFKTNKNSIYLK